jgi:hypothetical protein
MKRIFIIIVLSMVSSAFAGYDFIVTDGGSADLTLNGHQTLLMTGGAGDSLTLTEWSYAKILNTSPYSVYPTGGIRELGLMGYSHLDFYGGDVFYMGLGSYSTATLYGGKFQEIRSGQTLFIIGSDPVTGDPIYNSHIEIFARDWLYNAANKRLTGTWGDFSKFNIQLVDYTQYGYSPTIDNIKFTIVPEPLTLMLLTLGGLLIRRRK